MRLLLLIAFLPFALDPCAGSKSGKAGPLERPYDGIVLTGAELPGLAGAPPDAIAAFRWSGPDGWQQAPVQIDERAVVPWLQIYDGHEPPLTELLSPDDVVLTWCDESSFTGPDPDPAFDADDELALAAADSAERAPADAPLPRGALSAGATELKLFDPVHGDLGWLYLFRHDGSLDPTAGEDRVHYAFELASGLSYLDGYSTLSGPNPEVTLAESPGVYRMSFSDRWIHDGLWLEDGAPGAVDLLDRHRVSSDPPDCERDEDTFCGYGSSPSPGAFLANIDGPVRAIRSVAGANSGILTQRDHVLWPHRVDVITTTRVHPIGPIEDVLDLEVAALGARFVAPWAKGGIVLDGDPSNDPKPPMKSPTWDLTTGALGTLVESILIFSDQPGLSFDAIFTDDLAPNPPPCTGDSHAAGVFGLRNRGDLENTDPRLVEELGVLWTLVTERALYVEPTESPAGLSAPAAVALGKLRHKQHLAPIKVTPLPFGPDAPDEAAPVPPAEPLHLAASVGGRIVTELRLPGSGALRWSVAEGEVPLGLSLDPAGVLRGWMLESRPRRLVLRAENAAGAVDVELALQPAPYGFGGDLAGWLGAARRLLRALLGSS